MPAMVEFAAALLIVVYFALAIVTYMVQGYLKKTDNQLRNAPASAAWFMWSLVAAELGGFIILFYGVVVAIF